MKRTNIVVDEDLVASAKQATGIATMRQLVDHALRELLRHRRQADLLKLQGRIQWEGDLETMRQKRGDW